VSRRRLEVAVLLFGVLFLGLLIFHFRPARRPARRSSSAGPLPVAPADGGQLTTVLQGFDYTETLRGKPLFRIRSERTVGFGAAAGLLPDVYVLDKVTLTLYPEQGEPLSVQSDRAEYDQRTKQARLSGNVRWTDEKGSLGETDRVEFNPSLRVLLAPAVLHFTRGTFDLTARSGRYDLARRELTMEGPVQGMGTGEGSGGLTSLSAERAVYRKEESVIELEGRVSASSRGGDKLSADRLVLKMEGDGGRLQWARALGQVQGVVVSSVGSPQGAGAASTPGARPYSADSAALQFGADGQAQSLSLVGSPAVVSDARGRVAAKVIDVAFQAGRATSASARDSVHIQTETSRADARRASLSFGADGQIETVQLSGAVRMEGEGRIGRADEVTELAQRSVWILTGNQASTSVETEGSRISARRIEIDEKKRLLSAETEARAVFTPKPAAASAKSGGGPAPTLLGDPSRPTFGKAQKIVLDDSSRVATLTGGATLWQDASSLSGDAITLNDTARSLVAVGHTRAVLVSAPSASKPKPGEASGPTGPTVVTANRVLYREGESRVVFEQSVTMTREGFRASADTATAILGPDKKIERVEMSGGVSLADATTGRTGRAEHAIDFQREGKTVLEGAPAWVTDAQGDRVAGAVLTITERGRRVEVTAPVGGKTETTYRTRSS
jgi:lipopolysaccharide export system protein LptA